MSNCLNQHISFYFLKKLSTMKRILIWCGVGITTLLLIFLGVFYAMFSGRGNEFPSMATVPIMPSSAMEIVATLSEPPGNLAVSQDNRVFITYHAESRPEMKVLEIVNGQPKPYPNEEFQHERPNGEPFFDHIFNIRIDRQNRLWTLDHGFHGLKKPRLMAFDLATNKLVHDVVLPSDIAGTGSYIQDMQIDSSGEHIYIADIGVVAKKPAIIIYNTKTRTARRVLERHTSVTEEPYEINAQGRKMYPLGWLFWMHPALDPIALDKRDEWLYFGPMAGDKLFRARVADLNNAALSPEQLASRVELYAKKSQCDGLSMDVEDNIYVTSIEDGAINIIGKDRQQKTLIKHPKMRWPDGLSFGGDGYLYIADSDIPDVMMKSKSHIAASAPFYIFRCKPLANGVAGQ
jgi:sugar lactone lactonase YvrE